MLGILNNVFKPNLAQKFSRSKLHNALCLLILLYGSDIWVFKKKDKERLTSTGMKFFRRTAGYTLFDYKRNEKCLEELEVERDDERLRRFKAKWLRYTSITRMTNKILNYRQNGGRRLARLDVRGSVHHSTILTVKTPTRCNSLSKRYYSLVLNEA
jgi:hypothetical protein